MTVALWPSALSFGDEVGYVGQARLLLDGKIAPRLETPGAFHLGPGGVRVGRYPLFVPMVLVPVIAVHPRLAFAIGLGALLAATAIAARALRRWGDEPAFALLLLLHPTFILIARTVMPDGWLAAAALLAWWMLENGRRWRTVVMFAVVVLLKPTGIAIAAALAGGHGLRSLLERNGVRVTARQAVPPVVGIALGVIVAMALNWLSWGHLGYTYVLAPIPSIPPFSVQHLATSGVTYLVSLALVPPGLLLGAWGLWRRRELGPLLVVVGLVAMMSSYYFVDRGRSFAETLILAQRLVLPASAFLALGLGSLLSPLFARGSLRRASRLVLGVAAPAVALAIGWRHYRFQQPMHEALVAAERVAAAEGTSDPLGTTNSAEKTAVLHRGPVVLVGKRAPHPRVVLCSVTGASYRETYAASCALPGYEQREEHGPGRVLVTR